MYIGSRASIPLIRYFIYRHVNTAVSLQRWVCKQNGRKTNSSAVTAAAPLSAIFLTCNRNVIFDLSITLRLITSVQPTKFAVLRRPSRTVCADDSDMESDDDDDDDHLLLFREEEIGKVEHNRGFSSEKTHACLD